jgi:enamine deaminase RidA (YjgF/YER057c/UK114 family)
VARSHLGSLDKVTRVVKLTTYLATEEDFSAQPKVADGASELLRDVFGEDKLPVRMVLGVASLPLGVPVVVELLFEVKP